MSDETRDPPELTAAVNRARTEAAMAVLATPHGTSDEAHEASEVAERRVREHWAAREQARADAEMPLKQGRADREFELSVDAVLGRGVLRDRLGPVAGPTETPETAAMRSEVSLRAGLEDLKIRERGWLNAAAQTTKPAALHDYLAQNAKLVAGLGDALSKLESRLEPVLLTDDGANSDPGEPDNGCSLLNELGAHGESLARLVHRLESIARRLVL